MLGLSVLALHRIPPLDQPENQAEEKLREERIHPGPPPQEEREKLTNSVRRGAQLGYPELAQPLPNRFLGAPVPDSRSSCRSVSGEEPLTRRLNGCGTGLP
ncbi:hypothetical protein GCM10010104_53420 [Streptomyces indiaensis]|uniref:Uncharacterized protein n=1 Tax=Streptomyces indiaensis TaxID=284033 RepID=A0ABP5R7J1_9ACTN